MKADNSAAQRAAANARRYRERRNRGQVVLQIPVKFSRLVAMLDRRGYLLDVAGHDRNSIEAVLTKFVDDEGRR